jgi:VIT1/CCC1 family predicted Fe2+/Mn2+ transporter
VKAKPAAGERVESDREKVARIRSYWEDEQEGAAMYRALAEAADAEQREIFLELSRAEERHAGHWAKELASMGEPAPSAHPASVRIRLIGWLARRFGVGFVLPYVERAEIADASHYDRVGEALPVMALDERVHARVITGLNQRSGSERIRHREFWHRGGSSGSFRAAVFGVNDGLVSNVSLIMGVAGSQVGQRYILLAGLAGLLAGSFSMAAGEYVSMASQKEIWEREISLEREEISAMPEEEAEELALIYRAKGMRKEQAEELASRILKDPDSALDTLAREELGLNPDELGSPTGAATASFFSFAIGAAIPVLGYLLASGAAAFVTAVVATALASLVVGLLIGVASGKRIWHSGLRQVVVAAVAATATFLIGRLIGVGVH